MGNLEDMGYVYDSQSFLGTIDLWCKCDKFGAAYEYAIVWADYSTPKDKYGTPTKKCFLGLDKEKATKLLDKLTLMEQKQARKNSIAKAWGL